MKAKTLIGIALFAGGGWVENQLMAFLVITTYKLTSQYKLMAVVLLAARAMMVLRIMVLGRDRNQVADIAHILGVFSLVSEAETCICGKDECKNHQNDVPLEDLTDQPDEHKHLHEALASLDCTTVCRLLRSGMNLCYLGEKNCFTLIVKHWSSKFLDIALKLCPSAVNCRGPRGETLLMMCYTPEKFQTVLDHGANVNATNNDGVDYDAEDNEGQTAFQLLLQMFKPGYVFQQYSDGLVRQTSFTYYNVFGTRIASSLVSILLEVGAKLPSPDEHGRTPLMLAVQSTDNFETMKTLIGRGAVDINAVDANGYNAIYHVLAAAAGHQYLVLKYRVVDLMVTYLLDNGCQMQGTDLHLTHYFRPVKYKIVNYLMVMETSTLRERDFSLKNEIKNDPFNLSFLSVYIMVRSMIPCFPHSSMKLKDVTFIEQEIANGLDTNCGDCFRIKIIVKKAGVLKKMLSLTFPPSLKYTMESNLKLYTDDPDESDNIELAREERDWLMSEFQAKSQAVEGVQKLLLPFCPHPPLALLLLDERSKDYINSPDNEASILLRKRLMQFLYEVGGPLSPGSVIYRAVKVRLECNAKERSAHGQLLPMFKQLHSEVPSLLQLSRTALRSCLKKTDTRGLDVSSLRVLCQGKMRPIPPDIVDIINFKKASVSQMKVVPDMIHLFDEMRNSMSLRYSLSRRLY
ncbi:UNVERIFIED_CONTAM: hypothetical protein B566_EDAN018852 [Ephemera danica]|nr:hypothetical protein B566_EDAN018852 [Ephemera danica]